MVLSSEDACPLQNQLHCFPIFQLVEFGPRDRLPQRAADIPGIIKSHGRICWEIRGEDTRYPLLVRLKQGESGWQLKRYVVHAGSEPSTIWTLTGAVTGTGGAIVEP